MKKEGGAPEKQEHDQRRRQHRRGPAADGRDHYLAKQQDQFRQLLDQCDDSENDSELGLEHRRAKPLAAWDVSTEDLSDSIDSTRSIPRAHSPIVSPHHKSMKPESDHHGADHVPSSKEQEVNSRSALGWQSVKTSQEQLSSIYKFLDEVDSASNIESQSDYSRSPRRAEVSNQQPHKSEQDMFDWEKNELDGVSVASQSGGAGDSRVGSRRGQRGYENVKSKLMAMTLELEDKTHTVKLLQAARTKEKAAFLKQLQKLELEQAIERQLSFVDQLLADKEKLAKKCELLAEELENTKSKSVREGKLLREKMERDMQAAKEAWAAAEKSRRENWMAIKTKEVKQMTIKGLEPEVQRILDKHKIDIQRLERRAEEELERVRAECRREQQELQSKLRDNAHQNVEEALQREKQVGMQRLAEAERQFEAQLQRMRERREEQMDAERERKNQDKLRHAELQAEEVAKVRKECAKRLQEQAHKHMEEREEICRRHSKTLSTERDRVNVEQEHWQEKMLQRLKEDAVRKEEKMRSRMEKERDTQIDMVISKLQQENKQTKIVQDRQLTAQVLEARKEATEEFRAAKEAEASWMEKYMKCLKKVGLAESAQAEEKQRAEKLEQRCSAMEDRSTKLEAQLGAAKRKLLNHERKLEEEHTKRQKDSQQKLRQTEQQLEATAAKLESIQATHEADIEEIRQLKKRELEDVHSRVRQAVNRKNEEISNLQEELQDAQIRYQEAQRLLQKQRQEMVS